MEAIPRMPLIYFESRSYPFKTYPFDTHLKYYIRQLYQEDPKNFETELENLEKLRTQALNASKDVDGCAIMKKYYCQLCFLQKRFPALRDRLTRRPEAVYTDLLGLENKPFDFNTELVTLLYNIGALHTQLGAKEDKSTDEGLKLACTHYQCAAWAFQHIIDIPSSGGGSSLPGYYNLLTQLSLAQALECVLERSLTDNRKYIISAKVAAEVCSFYNAAVQMLYDGKKDDNMYCVDFNLKTFMIFTEFMKHKLSYYECLQSLLCGWQAEEDEKMGTRITYFNITSEKLAHAMKFPRHPEFKRLNQGFQEAVTYVRDIVEKKKENAIEENKFIYHEPVPHIDSLPIVKGTSSLVRPIPINCSDPDISGPDLFSRCVPLKIVKLSSIYSEEKAKLLRDVSAMVEQANAELELIMGSFEFDFLNVDRNSNDLPEELVERCAACDAKPELVPNLVKAMDNLSDEHHEVDAMLQEIMELIQDEENAEKEYQEKMKTPRPPSIVATDLSCEANKYMEGLKRASGSNETLNSAIRLHLINLKTLNLPLDDISKQLQNTDINYNAEELSKVKQLKDLVNKVDQMRVQRAQLYEKIREELTTDDIANQLVHGDDKESNEIIEEEIKKHDTLVNTLKQNLCAQQNILNALTDAYAAYAPIRKLKNELLKARQNGINALIQSYDEYDDVMQKVSKGMEYHKKLGTKVKKLLQRVKGTCEVQEQERDQIYAKSKTSKIEVPPVSSAELSLKLKDYLTKYKYSSESDASLPYNPYYNVASNKSSTSTPIDTSGQNYSNIVRLPPVGSEMTKQPLLATEPFGQQNVGYDQKLSAGYNVVNPLQDNYKPQTLMYNNSLQYPASVANTGAQQRHQNYSSVPQLSSTIPQVAQQSYTSVSQVVQPNQMYYNTPPSPAYSSFSQPTAHTPYSSQPTAYSTSNIPMHGVYAYDSKPESVPTIPTQTKPHSTAVYAYGSQPQVVPTLQTQTTTYSTGAYAYGSQSQAVPTIPTQTTTHSTGIYAYGSQAQGIPTQTTAPHSTSLYAYGSQPKGVSSIPTQTTTNSAGNISMHSVYAYGSQPQGVSTIPTETTVHSTSNAYNANSESGSASYYIPSQRQSYNAQTSYNTAVRSAATYMQPQSYNNPSTLYGGLVNQSQPYPMYGYHRNATIPGYNYGQTGAAISQGQTSSSYHPYSTTNYGEVINVAPNYYTSATGVGHGMSQIESSAISYDGQTYASHYASNNGSGGDSFEKYHSSEYGRRQSYTGGIPAANQIDMPDAATPMGNMPNNSAAAATYIQAGKPNDGKTICTADKREHASVSSVQEQDKRSQDTGISVKKENSYIDLLADLDFNISEPVLDIPILKSSSEVTKKFDELKIIDSADQLIVPTKLNNRTQENKVKQPIVSPFSEDVEVLNRFVKNAEKFEKYVERLNMKTLNGPTPLENMWNEFVAEQEKYMSSQTSNVAANYNSRNRFPDIVPYDRNRIKLLITSEDYINASYVENKSCLAPDFIITQAPLESTTEHFWEMIWEQDVEVIVCFATETQMDHVYWPKEKNKKLVIGSSLVTLHSINVQPCCIERIFSLTNNNSTRILTHLQITEWNSLNVQLDFISECLSFYYAQRDVQHHVVVHSYNGIDRCGFFILILTMICEINAGNEIPDVMAVLTKLSESRKNFIKDIQEFEFVFQTVLHYVRSILVKYNRRTLMKLETSPDSQKENIKTFDQVKNDIKNLDSSLPKLSAAAKKESNIPDRILSKEENKRRNMERFSSVGKTVDSLSSTVVNSDDPLSSIDPLWSIKKNQNTS